LQNDPGQHRSYPPRRLMRTIRATTVWTAILRIRGMVRVWVRAFLPTAAD
jgi:hypothetical protein